MATAQDYFEISQRPRRCGKSYDFHKLRYNDENATIAQRNESAQWLIDHGFIGLGGKMIIIRDENKNEAFGH